MEKKKKKKKKMKMKKDKKKKNRTRRNIINQGSRSLNKTNYYLLLFYFRKTMQLTPLHVTAFLVNQTHAAEPFDSGGKNNTLCVC